RKNDASGVTTNGNPKLSSMEACISCLHRNLPAHLVCGFFFSSRRRHTSFSRDWSSDVCSSDLAGREGDDQPVQGAAPEQAVGVADDAEVEAEADAEQVGRGRGQDQGGGQEEADDAELAEEVVEIGRASCRGKGVERAGGVSIRE